MTAERPRAGAVPAQGGAPNLAELAASDALLDAVGAGQPPAGDPLAALLGCWRTDLTPPAATGGAVPWAAALHAFDAASADGGSGGSTGTPAPDATSAQRLPAPRARRRPRWQWAGAAAGALVVVAVGTTTAAAAARPASPLYGLHATLFGVDVGAASHALDRAAVLLSAAEARGGATPAERAVMVAQLRRAETILHGEEGPVSDRLHVLLALLAALPTVDFPVAPSGTDAATGTTPLPSASEAPAPSTSARVSPRPPASAPTIGATGGGEDGATATTAPQPAGATPTDEATTPSAEDQTAAPAPTPRASTSSPDESGGGASASAEPTASGDAVGAVSGSGAAPSTD